MAPRKAPTEVVNMRGSPCLYRRPSGIYAVRIVVPKRLRGLVGRGEIHTSTGCKDCSAAKVVALRIQLYWRDHFVTLNIELLSVANPLLQGDGAIGIQEAAAIIGMTPAELMGAMLNDDVPVLTFVQNLLGWQVSDIHDIDQEEGSYLWDDVEAKGRNAAHTGYLRFHDSTVTLSGLIADGTYKESVFRGSGRSAIFLMEEMDVPLSRCTALKSAIERIRFRLAGYVPHVPLNASKTVPDSPAPASLLLVSDTISGQFGHTPFSELYEIYKADREWKEDQTRRMNTETRLFIELMDNPRLGDINKKLIIEYARRLALLPSDIYQSTRKYKVGSIKELIPIAKQHSLKLKNSDTIKGHIGRLSEVLNYAATDGGMMQFNPASNYKRGRGKKSPKRDQDQRQVFSPEELLLIYSQDWFNNGTGETYPSGWTTWRPFRYWLPLLGLLSGGRLNELSQLYLNDIVQSAENSDIWYIDFNLNTPDKIDSDESDFDPDKTLKSVNAIRVVPIHNVLIKAGLIEYVDALRKAGHTRLFPELKHDTVKGYGKPAGSWFNEKFLGKKLGIVRNGQKTFHSLRHCFLTATERNDVPERVMVTLAGHERGKSQSMSRYAKDRSAAELKGFIDRLIFPCLNDVAQFKIKAGLKAVKSCLRLKAALAKAKRTRLDAM